MDRYKETKRVGIAGILGNIFLLIIKGFVGLMSGSQAMIADAANSAGDIFASAMTFIGNKLQVSHEMKGIILVMERLNIFLLSLLAYL